MKKKYCIISLVLCNILLCGCNNDYVKKMGKINNCEILNNEEDGSDKVEVLNYNEVKDSLIRFHVIANSDNEKDQSLKLKVRDAILDYLYPYMNKSQSLSETRSIIKNNLEKVQDIAGEVIKKNNYNYNVKVTLSRENFPEKQYGDIVLPQGNYEAFRVIIGSGEGHNWWCVMFPPLCFVDESKAIVEYDKAKGKSEINKSDNTKKEDDNKIEYKFKILEIFKDLSS